MDTYAMQAKWHMWKYGTTQQQIAVGAAKNHNYGALNDKAQYRFQMTPQSVSQSNQLRACEFWTATIGPCREPMCRFSE